MRKWVSYRSGSKLMGSDAVWSYHFVISTDYSYTSSIDMANIIKIQLKFVATTSDWTISIDELKAYPNGDKDNWDNVDTTGMGDPTRAMGAASEATIMNSGLPESVKKAMIENPIAQPTMNHTFNLDDVSELIDEKPMGNQDY